MVFLALLASKLGVCWSLYSALRRSWVLLLVLVVISLFSG